MLFSPLNNLKFVWCLYFIFSLLYPLTKNENSEQKIIIDHNISGVWHSRGSVKFIPPSVIRRSATSREKWLKLQIKNKPLTDQDQKDLLQMSLTGQFYSIRLPCDLYNPKLDQCSVIASIPSNDLVLSKGIDQIAIHLNDQNMIVGVDYHTPYQSERSFENQKGAFSQTELGFEKFVSTAYVVQMKIAPEPIMHKGYGKDVLTEKKKEQSFFRKYWYLLILFILIICTGFLS
ncbi:hypothetical protein M0813_11461 [Anaeramoeba flamelloides]|uniref:ER membrane protein complex subunit 10 n=1 Tax=Anaeramoeba flamelloides TaxID=1746091 RepID=A0AAV7Y355_9EUKA|nr:hypothetical protein M0812_29827 [Anaeramoeba flamelloides]KAJ6255378.1 hypothetical protein M0813_11461 [Anaeramoeba flamelloides]